MDQTRIEPRTKNTAKCTLKSTAPCQHHYCWIFNWLCDHPAVTWPMASQIQNPWIKRCHVISFLSTTTILAHPAPFCPLSQPRHCTHCHPTPLIAPKYVPTPLLLTSANKNSRFRLSNVNADNCVHEREQDAAQGHQVSNKRPPGC